MGQGSVVEFGAGATLLPGAPPQAELPGDEGRGRGDEGAREGAGYVEVIEAQGLGCLGLGREPWNALLVLEHGHHTGHGGASCDRVLGAQEGDSYHFQHLIFDAVVPQVAVHHGQWLLLILQGPSLRIQHTPKLVHLFTSLVVELNAIKVTHT